MCLCRHGPYSPSVARTLRTETPSSPAMARTVAPLLCIRKMRSVVSSVLRTMPVSGSRPASAMGGTRKDRVSEHYAMGDAAPEEFEQAISLRAREGRTFRENQLRREYAEVEGNADVLRPEVGPRIWDSPDYTSFGHTRNTLAEAPDQAVEGGC
jgi:hypothetical protein